MRFNLTAFEDIQSGTGKVPSVYTSEFEAIALPDILQEIEQFLRGCGFHIYNIDYDTNLLDK